MDGAKIAHSSYLNTPEWEECYKKTKYANKLLRRRISIRGKLSRSARRARTAALRSVHNKCVKKLKLNVPLEKPGK